MAAVVGFAFLLTAVTPVGKRVFLLVITTIPNAMRGCGWWGISESSLSIYYPTHTTQRAKP